MSLGTVGELAVASVAVTGIGSAAMRWVLRHTITDLVTPEFAKQNQHLDDQDKVLAHTNERVARIEGRLDIGDAK